MWWPFKKREAPVKRAKVARRRDYTAADEYDDLGQWTTGQQGTVNAILMAVGDKIRARARWQVRNSEIAVRFVEFAKRNVVGYEMRYKNRGDWRKDKKLEQALIAHDKALAEQSHADNFTVSGGLSRGETENLIVEHMVRDGEAVVQRLRGYRGNRTGYALRLLDPEMIATYLTSGRSSTIEGMQANERIIAGIGVDENYKPIAYYFHGNGQASDISNLFTVGAKITRVPADDILHLFRKGYANQLRGVSWLAPVLRRMETLRRYEDTALSAARSGAAKHMVVETQQGASYKGDDEEDSVPEVSMSGEELTVMSAGEKLIMNDPAYPHEMFKPFEDTIKTNIATGLDSTPAFLTGLWAEINFSAGQLMSLDERDKWETVQQFVADRLCRWWHEDWVRWMAQMNRFRDVAGRLIPPTAIKLMMDCVWEGKRFAPIDPAKAAVASGLRIKNKTNSITQEIRDRGGDPEQVFQEIAVEESLGLQPKDDKSGIMPPSDSTGDEKE